MAVQMLRDFGCELYFIDSVVHLPADHIQVLGRHLTKDLWPRNSILKETLYHSCLKNIDPMRSRFCTGHGNVAAVTCANVWPDWIIRVTITRKELSKDFNPDLIDPFCFQMGPCSLTHTMADACTRATSCQPSNVDDWLHYTQRWIDAYELMHWLWHWKLGVVIMPTLSCPLTAEVAFVTITGATSYYKVGIRKTPWSQWKSSKAVIKADSMICYCTKCLPTSTLG